MAQGGRHSSISPQTLLCREEDDITPDRSVHGGKEMALSRFRILPSPLSSTNTYLAFGFVAALLESLPVLGLAFSISNRIGAAMWAHDLEKRQHLFVSGELKPLTPYSRHITYQGEHITFLPNGTVLSHTQDNVSGDVLSNAREIGQQSQTRMAGSWGHEGNS